MAAMSDADRVNLFAEINRDHTAIEGLSLTKAELRAALNAADDWLSSNAASFNAALPQPARGSLTAGQKASLLMYVARQRRESGA